jgi:type I site-specific restriction endonuclease
MFIVHQKRRRDSITAFKNEQRQNAQRINLFLEPLIYSGNAEEFVLRDEAQGARSAKPARTWVVRKGLSTAATQRFARKIELISVSFIFR